MLLYLSSQFLIKIRITIILIHFQKNIHMNNINMIYYDRIDVLEGIDINKTNESKECNIYHYCFFFQIKDLDFKRMFKIMIMIY